MSLELKYVFSGHESFPCKTLWLKKGYDFIEKKGNFNAVNAVVDLGVGKNMVSSIRYWMKSFGLYADDDLTAISKYLLDSNSGKDPYIEDLGTLWIFHYLLVRTGEASLYHLFFTRFQKERKLFERQHLINFIKREMMERGKLKQYNENTVKKDVAVLLQNYVLPSKAQVMDDYSSLLIDLELIRTADGKNYAFNYEGKRQIPLEVLLYAILCEKGEENTIPYDTLHYVAMIFCLNDMEMIAKIQEIQDKYPNHLRYSDVAGMRQLHILQKIDVKSVLDIYYNHETV